jgi:hypothetical protein
MDWCWASTQNLPTHAEHIQKNVVHLLCMRVYFLAYAQHALTVKHAAAMVLQGVALTPATSNSKDDSNHMTAHNPQERKRQHEWKQQQDHQHSRDANNSRDNSKSNEAITSMQGGQTQHGHH